MAWFGLGDRVDDNLRDLLSRLESHAPTVHVSEPLLHSDRTMSGGDTPEEAMLRNSRHWSASLHFQETTSDGELQTSVDSDVHTAIVSVYLRPGPGRTLELAHLVYTDGQDPFCTSPARVKSRISVEFVRDYVRRRALPVAKENLARRERERAQNEKRLADMRRKYVP
jgi:hypothetical protein